MVGTDARGELTAERTPSEVPRRGSAGAGDDSRLRFAIASPADDAAIRRLLRKNPTRGAISVSFEREPTYFRGEAGAHTGDDRTIVAYEHGRLVCMGRCVMRPRFVNGEIRRVGYLGELRLDASARRSVETLRGGYRFFRELQRDHPADLYFTSIAADNERARRVLERGLPGLPRYEYLTEFVTLLIAVGRAGTPLPAVAAPSSKELQSFLNAHARCHQLASPWSPDDIAGLDDRITVRDGSDLVGAAVLADQRAWRQTVVRDYAPGLALVRPIVNLAASFLRAPRLPRVGAIVPAAFLSPLAILPGHESRLPELVRAAFAPARARGVDLLTLGFAADDPRLAIVRRNFRRREYRSRLYRVTWPEIAGHDVTFDGRLFLPEVASL